MKTTCATFGQLADDKMKKWIDARENEGYVFTNAVGSNGMVTIFMTCPESWAEVSVDEDTETDVLEAIIND